MIDLVKEFPRLEKQITRYVRERVDAYDQSQCKKLLAKRIARLNSSWDMQVSGNGDRRRNQNAQQFMAQMSYPLVKQQILVRRAIFSNNFRSDPVFTLRAIGNTPQENAINMSDLVQSNNEQVKFRPEVLQPSIDHTSRWGVSVVYTEYGRNQERGWRTIADPVYGARRVHGIIRNTHNANCHVIDPHNYFQNPAIADCDHSDFRGHRERWKLSKLIDRIRSHPEVYIKENVEKVIKIVKGQNSLDKEFYDAQGLSTAGDYDKIAINDILRGQFQISIDGNEDDSTFYYLEMIGDVIIRFQDNPYDMNMNQYTVLTCEPRYEYWWGNTPAEYSIGNENSMNLLLGLSVENALESMRKYIFYNKNAIDPSLWQHAASSGKIPVDVNKDISLNNLLWTYQTPDSSSGAVADAYSRILENDQRVSTSPDLNRPTSSGGPSNKTATAANIMANKGDTQDADLLERYSYCLSKVGEKEAIILAQFLGNFGPILIKPSMAEAQRMVTKAEITGNFNFVCDTALQQSYLGELQRYQNIITWLQNLVNGGAQIQPNLVPLARQVLKMGKFLKIDEVLPEQQSNQQSGYQPTAVMPGQEMAGAAQELPQAVAA